MRKTTRTVTVDVSFIGSGRVASRADGFAFSGGVVPPQLEGKMVFKVYRETPDKEGLWNPVDGEGTFRSGLQINIWAESEGYRELGRYFLALAELNTDVDPGYHEHHDQLRSADDGTRVHVICRKAPREDWPG
jgi:hypothetical protein